MLFYNHTDVAQLNSYFKAHFKCWILNHHMDFSPIPSAALNMLRRRKADGCHSWLCRSQIWFSFKISWLFFEFGVSLPLFFLFLKQFYHLLIFLLGNPASRICLLGQLSHASCAQLHCWWSYSCTHFPCLTKLPEAYLWKWAHRNICMLRLVMSSLIPKFIHLPTRCLQSETHSCFIPALSHRWKKMPGEKEMVYI